MPSVFAPERYRFALAAGGLVMRDNAVLLVHNFEEGGDDFWVLPGGGAEEGESIDRCAEREVWEETGLRVRVERLLYVEQFLEDLGHGAKLWFLCKETEQREITAANEPDHEPIVEVRFLTKDQMKGKTVYPTVLKDQFWQDLAEGFPEVRILPVTDLRTAVME